MKADSGAGSDDARELTRDAARRVCLLLAGVLLGRTRRAAGRATRARRADAHRHLDALELADIH
eukprot:98021-Rhodomonas_salina.1